MEWAEIASKMQDLPWQPFTTFDVHACIELLLGQYASTYRTNRCGLECGDRIAAAYARISCLKLPVYLYATSFHTVFSRV